MTDEMERGHGCIMLDELVHFDIGRVPAAGERALVVQYGGGLVIATVAHRDLLPEPGFVYVEEVATSNRRPRIYAKVALVGAVTSPAGRVLRAP